MQCQWNLGILGCCRLLILVMVLRDCPTLGVPVGQTPEGEGLLQCRRAQAPRNSSHGVNRLAADNWDPLYRLQLSDFGLHEYKVSIQLGSKLLPFSDAFVSAETNGSCGVGQLIYDSSDFFRVEQTHTDCPLLLTTNRKSVMQRLPPLRWKAPRCGCVHFRAMVLESSTIYYAEHPGVAGGPLATTVCVGGPAQQPAKLSHEERAELLCLVTERFSGLEIHQRPQFLKRRRLEPRYMDLRATELALSTRRSDVSVCCAQSGEERQECLNDIRRRRVDNFCEDGSPEIPFTASRSRFMRQREKACCWRLGESRYSCFSQQAGTSHGAWSADFSLDETDPLNDLGDYPEEIHDLEKEYGMTLFSWDTPDSTKTSSLAVTSAPTTSPTPTPTTPTPGTTDQIGVRAREQLPPPEGRSGGWSGEDLTLPKGRSGGWSGEDLTPRKGRSGGWSGEELTPPKGRSGGWSGEELTPPEGRSSGWSGKELAPPKGRSGGWSGEQLPHTLVGEEAVVDTAFISREIGEQQGGRSIDKTFSKLQRRMWKLSLRTRCCRGGVAAARTTYGDFSAVWAQCSHSATKHLSAHRVQHGHNICSAQFQRCCMEMAISTPAEGVTWEPDSASSREWDRDRHLVNTVYLPPHARAPALPALPSPQRRPDLAPRGGGSSAERRSSGVSSAVLLQPDSSSSSTATKSTGNTPARKTRLRTSAAFVDEVEDEEPQNNRQRRPRKQSSRESGVAGRARQSSEEVGDWFPQAQVGHLSKRQRRLRNSRERLSQAGGRSRDRSERVHRTEASSKLRARRRFIDDPEIEEEPKLKKPRRRGNSGGRSSERRNRHSKKQSPVVVNTRPAAGTAEVSGGEKAVKTAEEKAGEMTSVTNTQAVHGQLATETSAERRKRRHEREEKQLKKLVAEIAEEIEEEEEEIYEEEKDLGSEENLDTLGLNSHGLASDVNDDDDSDSGEDGISEDSIEVDEVNDDDDADEEDSEQTHINTNSEDTKQDADNNEAHTSLSAGQATEIRQAETGNPKQETAAKETAPTANPQQQREAKPAASSERRTRLRTRLRVDLSSEDGHSRLYGGRSSRRRRKNIRKRKKHRKFGPSRRMRFRHSRRELSEALEED